MTTNEDGRTGNTALIDSNNRAHVASVMETESGHASDLGERYHIDTGDIAISDAVKLPVLYFKNNEDDPLTVTDIVIELGASTSGASDVLIDIIRNPTAGGIVTSANDCQVGPGVSANQNFGSSNVLVALAYKGAVGEAVFTDGAVTRPIRLPLNSGRVKIPLETIVIPKGKSLGINYTPPTSNTSQTVQFGLSCYRRTEKVNAPDS